MIYWKGQTMRRIFNKYVVILLQFQKVFEKLMQQQINDSPFISLSLLLLNENWKNILVDKGFTSSVNGLIKDT